MNTHREGNLTKVIESQTSKVPSGVFLTVALTVMAASLTLKCLGRKHKHTSLFVEQWAAPLLIMGLYNKLVKTEGHD
ncbi:MAG: hypothetical protein LIP04_02585 [Tannerellaceae bacterium]|nr:hypothetical protein [Tannerellaceae bacterium]